MQVFSSCREWGLLFTAMRGLLISVAAAVAAYNSGAQAQELWRSGLVARQHVGSSQTRYWTHVPCISSWILNHRTTTEVPGFSSSSRKELYLLYSSSLNSLLQHHYRLSDSASALPGLGPNSLQIAALIVLVLKSHSQQTAADFSRGMMTRQVDF